MMTVRKFGGMALVAVALMLARAVPPRRARGLRRIQSA